MERIGQIIVVALSIYTVAAQDATVQVTTGKLEKGKPVLLTCIVQNLNFVSQSVKWYRIDNKDNNLFKELSSHNQLSVPEDKYSLEVTQENGGFIYKLTIKKWAKSQDGKYKCEIINTSGNQKVAQATVDLLFKQPISSLSLTVGPNRYDSGSVVNELELDTFQENMPIICLITGSNPAAQVTVTIGEENVTPRFDRDDKLEVVGNTYESVRTYTTEVDSTGKYELTKDKVNKPIVCKAWIMDQEDKALEVSAVIKVKAPPTTTCTNVTTRLGDRRVMITCMITASPIVTDPQWVVHRPSEMVKVPVTKSETQGFTGDSKKINDTTIEVTLSIDQVDETHFDSTFYLEAKSEGPPISHAVRIFQKSQAKNSTNAGSSTGGQGRLLIPTTVLASVVLVGAAVKRLL